MICSKIKLGPELDKIKQLLIDNGYPADGQHLIANSECAKTFTDDNFRIIGQARSSFHLSVLESVYIKIQNLVLCRQKEFFSHWDSSSKLC